MKIAVIITTYQRKDGMTPYFLKRALDSVFAQTHKDFKVFLIGDLYRDHDEFYSIARQYASEKLFTLNIGYAAERDKYEKYILWCCGGVEASNIGLFHTLDQGFIYIAHLDHDDYWDKDHLFYLNNAIEINKADFVCAKSKYGACSILPRNTANEMLVEFIPSGGNVINSATCFNYKTIPLWYRNVFEIEGKAIPADADLWDRMSQYIIENKLKSFMVNQVTCFHEEEGHTFA